MNRDEGSYQLSHVYNYLSCPPQRTVVPKKAAGVAKTSTSIQLKVVFDEFT